MKVSNDFQNTIQNYLNGIASDDAVLAEKMKNPKKSIELCCQYILNEVQKSGCNGFADAEIYGMALHYYDEENIDVGKPINARVVVNHTVESKPTKKPIKQAKKPQRNAGDSAMKVVHKPVKVDRKGQVSLF